jgi:hypothetical protein
MSASRQRIILARVAVIAGLIGSPAGGYAASITIGSASGTAGSQVQFTVTLNTMGQQVAGVANDILFDPAAPIVECSISPQFAGFSATTLLPGGCTPGVDCRRSRVLIIQFPPLPIEDGAVLYTCTVEIAAGAPGTSYPLTCSAPAVSDPRGHALPVECTDGEVQVVPISTCVGDCNGDGTVAVNEIITLVNMALGTETQLDACRDGVPLTIMDAADIDIALIVQATNNALNGCGAQ